MSTSRWRWLLPALLLLAWLAVAGVGGQYQGRLAEVQTNDNASFLPAGAESTTVLNLQAEFSDSQALPAFVIVENEPNDQPLSPEQLEEITAFAEAIPTLEVPVEGYPSQQVGDFLAPGPIPVIPAEDGAAALILVNFDDQKIAASLPDGESPLEASVVSIREAELELEASGLNVYVAGPGGQLADLVEAFGEIDGILLLVALLAVLVILLIVYRSPVLPLLVILSAIFALSLASGLVFFLAKNEFITLNGQSQGILFILVVGAATDYALLLVARYREELRGHDDRYEAMAIAWKRSLEPILASAGTVILGLLCLLLSDLASNKALGPTGALGVGAAAISALTFLPAVLLLPGIFFGALGVAAAAGIGAAVGSAAGINTVVATVVGLAIGLVIAYLIVSRSHRGRAARLEHGDAVEAGRWVFWPGVPHVGSAETESAGVWGKVAGLVGRHPRRVWVVTAVALGVLAAFVPTLKADGISQSDIFLAEVESVTGQEALNRHFPAGSGAPTVIIAPQAELAATLDVVNANAGVVPPAIVVTETGAPDGAPKVVDGLVQVQATLAAQADAPEAEEVVRELRTELDAVSTDVLVGGNTAINLDVRDTSVRDRNVIIPSVLLVIFVVLALLLRALVAPAILIAANVLSFAATLGASALVFNHIFKFPGGDPSISLFGFIFLVALGIDYSIFLMTRVREESIKLGTRPGILRGLTVTGGVITSAGIVLAATFAALGVLPILFLAQIAFIVAFGVLLDTFVVRSLLVPALSYDVGSRIWWPHPLSKITGTPGDAAAPPVAMGDTDDNDNDNDRVVTPDTNKAGASIGDGDGGGGD